MAFKNTGAMCLVYVYDPNRPDGMRSVDMGNFYDNNGVRVLVTTPELAEKYAHLVPCPVYVRRPTKRAADDAERAARVNGPNHWEKLPDIDYD